MSAEQPYYQHHIFFCTNVRDGQAACQDHKAFEAFDYCKARTKAAGLTAKGKVRVNQTGCLDRCAGGPVAVVYPQGTWYSYVDRSDIDEIIDRHLTHGEVVERLVLPEHIGR